MKFHGSFLKIINSEVKQRIVSFLLNYDTPMSERELASLAGVSHMTVNRTLRELEAWNFVQFKRVGRAHVWKINQKSYSYSIISDLLNRFNKFSNVLKELSKDIVEHMPVNVIAKVVLFGSIVRSEENIDSDIDVFILLKNKKNAVVLDTALEKLSIYCLEKYGNRLAPYILTEKEIKEKKGIKLIEEIQKGIQLYPKLDKVVK